MSFASRIAVLTVTGLLTHIFFAFASANGGQCNTPNATAQNRIDSLAAIKAANPG